MSTISSSKFVEQSEIDSNAQGVDEGAYDELEANPDENLLNHGENDVDESAENAIDIIREFGTHRLMDRVHEAFASQLTETNQRLEAVIIEKQEVLKRLTNDRELNGVQLYSLQQQLARIQVALESSHEEYSTIVNTRINNEENLKSLSKLNIEKKAMYDEYNKQHAKYATELSSLNEAIRSIEKHNDQVKTDIAVTRRAAYKTEQAIQQLEKVKENQDTYTDNLSKQIKTLQQQIAMYSSQLSNQQSETAEAANVVMETAKELELISNEKKHLLIQWKSALSGLSRRDEALAQATITLKNAEAAVYDYDVEIDGVKRLIQKEQERHESLSSMKDRLENDYQWVEENLSKMFAERDSLQDRYTLLKKSLNQSDVDNKKLDNITKTLNNESENLLQSIQIVIKERQTIEEEIQIVLSTKSNISKAVETLMKEQLKVIKTIHELENELSAIENEIARVRVDGLNSISLNDTIKEQVESVNKAMASKEGIISKYQLEIRQRNDEIEKKMYRVDRLNKKYEKMIENVGGEENLGPLENTIRNLKKESDSLTIECKELEREWLLKQSDLVTIITENNKLNEEADEYSARLTLMVQQSIRLQAQLSTLKTNVKLSNQIHIDLQKDIQKLNGLINQNHDSESNLQHVNFILEKECLDELKDLEIECKKLEATINDVKTSKASLLDEIMNMERQASLWEKKIQLEKETKEALDPHVGQQETMNMEKEIRRMTLRYDALKREQERLVKEMEQAIYKRSAISNRYTSKSSDLAIPLLSASISNSSTTSAPMTQAVVKKRIGALRKELRALNEETASKVIQINEKKASMAEISSELERTTMQYSETEEISSQLQNQMNDLLYQKQLQQERIHYKQKFIKSLKELSGGTGIDYSQALHVERRVLAATHALDNVKEILGDLKINYPHLEEVLERVTQMTDVDIDLMASAQQ